MLALPQAVYNGVWSYGTLAMFAIFAIFETWAFVDGKPSQFTYSAWVWRHVGTRDGWNKKSAISRVILLVGLLWLAEHFTFGIF